MHTKIHPDGKGSFASNLSKKIKIKIKIKNKILRLFILFCILHGKIQKTVPCHTG
jgi:uncharacterized protein (UPF0262 family)